MYTQYLIPMMEDTLDHLYILECTLGTAASVLGNPRTPVPLAWEIHALLWLAEKKINHQKKCVNHWCSYLFRDPKDTLQALRTWIVTPSLKDESPSPPPTLDLIYLITYNTKSPESGDSYSMMSSPPPSPIWDVYNYHCADLINTFHNISTMVWRTPIQPGGNLDQFAVDLIRRMLSANIEQYLVPVIETLQKGGPRTEIPLHTNLRDFVFRKHKEVNDSVVPDWCHSNQFVKDVNKDTDEIRQLTTTISDLLDRIQGNAEWITDGQRDGYPGKFFTHKETETMNTAISDLDLHHYITPVPPPVKRGWMRQRQWVASFPDYTRPTTRSMTNASCCNRRQHCIHCKGNHESANHHSATAIPPVHCLPARPTQCSQDPMPGPSAPSHPTQPTPNACHRCTAHYAKKRKEYEEFLARKACHSPNQCNRCINGHHCDYADINSDDDHYLGYSNLNDAGLHNINT